MTNHEQQRAVLVAFGPADALGRALARSRGDDPARMRRSAGFGLIASLALLFLTFILDSVIDLATGSTGPMLGVTFLAFSAVPLALLPAIVTLRRLNTTGTRASRAAYRCGIAGVTGAALLGKPPHPPASPDRRARRKADDSAPLMRASMKRSA